MTLPADQRAELKDRRAKLEPEGGWYRVYPCLLEAKSHQAAAIGPIQALIAHQPTGLVSGGG